MASEKQRQAAKSIIGAQQQPVIPSVAEPTRQGSAEHGEYTGRSEQPGPGNLTQSVVDAGGDQVRADEAIGRCPADEITTSNQPEIT